MGKTNWKFSDELLRADGSERRSTNMRLRRIRLCFLLLTFPVHCCGSSKGGKATRSERLSALKFRCLVWSIYTGDHRHAVHYGRINRFCVVNQLVVGGWSNGWYKWVRCYFVISWGLFVYHFYSRVSRRWLEGRRKAWAFFPGGVINNRQH